MKIIYTLGYSGWKPEQVQAEVERLDAVLVDVRMVPRPRWTPVWQSGALHARLGERYVWLREFGNVNYKGTFEQIKIADFEAGAAKCKALADTGKAVVLMCGCRDVNVCHRKVLAERLAKEWKVEVVHLQPPGLF